MLLRGPSEDADQGPVSGSGRILNGWTRNTVERTTGVEPYNRRKGAGLPENITLQAVIAVRIISTTRLQTRSALIDSARPACFVFMSACVGLSFRAPF